MRAAEVLPALIQAARDGPDAVLDVVTKALVGFERRDTKAQPRAALFTRGKPRVLFSGHVDVVPVGEGWTRDPFGGALEDNRIWGRGACDMLGSIACFIAAAQSSEKPCAILLTTDEETGMKAAEHAIGEGMLSGITAVIVGEPTSMEVGIAEKGVLWLRVEAQGVNAHGSMPELGDNAIERVMRIASRMKAPEGRHPLLGSATLSVNRVGGGDAVNQVPALAWLEADIRYLPGQKISMDKAAGDKAKVIELSNHAPFEIDSQAPLAVAALRAAKRQAIGLPYGTEASKFAPAGFPTVILGPGEPGLAHTNRESIALSDLERGTGAYAELLEGLQ